MIILDTNVLSELLKPEPSHTVFSWLRERAGSLYVTSITQAEILYGIMRLPSGRRRAALETAAGAVFDQDFAGRILPFGSDAAAAYAHIAVVRTRAGRPISTFDAQIAAIAASVRAAVATRDVDDFEGCGIRVVNPWSD